jgi:hypothetical protein
VATLKAKAMALAKAAVKLGESQHTKTYKSGVPKAATKLGEAQSTNKSTKGKTKTVAKKPQPAKQDSWNPFKAKTQNPKAKDARQKTKRKNTEAKQANAKASVPLPATTKSIPAKSKAGTGTSVVTNLELGSSKNAKKARRRKSSLKERCKGVCPDVEGLMREINQAQARCRKSMAEKVATVQQKVAVASALDIQMLD